MPILNGIEVLHKAALLNAIKLSQFIIISGDIKLLSEIRKYNFVYDIIQKNRNVS